MLFAPPSPGAPSAAAPSRDDATLLRAAAAGEAAALAQLYRRHGAAVYRYAWSMTGSEAGAADVVQDCFIAVLDRAADFDPRRGSLAGYLCGIARHLALRAGNRRLDFSDDIGALADAAPDAAAAPSTLPPLPADAAERAQALRRLHAAIARLPAHYRDVLVLVELQELSYAEVAALAGLALGTVRSRLARARARLLELLTAADAMDD